MPGIGLLNEKPLHASLKKWYASPGDKLEVLVDGFVIDIVRDDLLLEIQTGSFAAIKPKLNKLTSSHHVRLIYPIALEKWIVKLPSGNCSQVSRRKSPRRGRSEDLFWEMVSFPHLLANPNFSVEVVLTREEEVRRYDGKRGWRRRGWVTEERRLLEVIEQRLYEEPADLHAFLPDDFETFTAGNLANAIDVRSHLAQKMVYCMRKATSIELVGKRGRANLYRVERGRTGSADR
jgi:hypothetical protein